MKKFLILFTLIFILGIISCSNPTIPNQNIGGGTIIVTNEVTNIVTNESFPWIPIQPGITNSKPEQPEEKPEEPTNPYQGIAGKIPVDYMFVVGKRFVYLEGGYVWSEFIINPNGTVTHSDKSVITKEMGNIQYDERGYLKSFTVIFNRALGDGSYAHRRLIVKFNNNNYTVAEVHDTNWLNYHNISIIEGQCCREDHNKVHANFNVEI